MLHITEKEAREAVNISAILSAFRCAYLRCVEGESRPGPRMVADVDDSGKKGQWLTAFDAGTGFFGTKFSAVFPTNPSEGRPATISCISLYSLQTGELLAVIEANALTALKTAASAGIATDLSARKDASSLVVIGTGIQAYDQVLAIRKVREIQRVLVYDRDSNRAASFVESLEALADWDATIAVASSANAAVAQADILCTCTTSHTPVFDGNILKAGTHVNAIGSYAPDMQEIDATTVLRAESVVTEHVESVWAAAGDILDPFRSGLIDKSKVTGSIGDVLKGTVRSRTADTSITLYESVGSAVLDLAIAIEVYKDISAKTSL